MNDNPTSWEAGEFQIRHESGQWRPVVGMIRGVWGVYDWSHNGIEWTDTERLRCSITHIPTGLKIGMAKHGAAAFRIVDELALEPRFAIAGGRKKIAGLRDIADDIFKRHGAQFTPRDAA